MTTVDRGTGNRPPTTAMVRAMARIQTEHAFADTAFAIINDYRPCDGCGRTDHRHTTWCPDVSTGADGLGDTP